MCYSPTMARGNAFRAIELNTNGILKDINMYICMCCSPRMTCGHALNVYRYIQIYAYIRTNMCCFPKMTRENASRATELNMQYRYISIHACAVPTK